MPHRPSRVARSEVVAQQFVSGTTPPRRRRRDRRRRGGRERRRRTERDAVTILSRADSLSMAADVRADRVADEREHVDGRHKIVELAANVFENSTPLRAGLHGRGRRRQALIMPFAKKGSDHVVSGHRACPRTHRKLYTYLARVVEMLAEDLVEIVRAADSCADESRWGGGGGGAFLLFLCVRGGFFFFFSFWGGGAGLERLTSALAPSSSRRQSQVTQDASVASGRKRLSMPRSSPRVPQGAAADAAAACAASRYLDGGSPPRGRCSPCP